MVIQKECITKSKYLKEMPSELKTLKDLVKPTCNGLVLMKTGRLPFDNLPENISIFYFTRVSSQHLT